MRLAALLIISYNLYICYMESLLIHPENAEQLKTVKAVLKALKVKFELQTMQLPDHVVKGIEKSLRQHDEGQTFSFEEFKARNFKG